MKVCVIVPTSEQVHQAGVRIRYLRIRPALEQLGHQLDILALPDWTEGAKRGYDVYLISKCYDARALLIACQLSQSGKIVGVDLFDDYFSQTADSRFVRLRYWLRTLIGHCSFVLCSTPQMRDLAQQYTTQLPVHILNDPAPAIDEQGIAATLTRKLDIARTHRRIDVAWFGMGDSPDFPLGLTDLAAFGCEVDRLRGYGYSVHLEVLTNRRAMTSDTLAALRSLATPYTLEEWDEPGEQALLDRSLISFLPVNAQCFSRVKSLNRAVTALSSGVQVLSSGYSLYDRLQPFIYRNARQFIHDLHCGRTSLRAETVKDLVDRLSAVAHPEAEAFALAQFLTKLTSNTRRTYSATSKNHKVAIIHGTDKATDVHKFTQKNKALSVASPFSRPGLKYDLIFSISPETSNMEIAIKNVLVETLDDKFRKQLQPNASSDEYQTLVANTALPNLDFKVGALVAMETLGSAAAAYPLVMQSLQFIMGELFPNVTCFHAEKSKVLPWQIISPQVMHQHSVAK